MRIGEQDEVLVGEDGITHIFIIAKPVTAQRIVRSGERRSLRRQLARRAYYWGFATACWVVSILYLVWGK